MNITRGIIPTAKKVVIYGPEGIGKTTFAAQFPGAVFLDTEGSTVHMDVARLDTPITWADILATVDWAIENHSAIGTFIVDTMDWAEAMAFRDYLTGLYNRNYLERWLDRQMQPQAAWPVTFISLDVNDLKKLNDEYGHKAGDSLLVTLSELLKRHFGQKGCSIIRNGGDEFLVLCSGMDKDTAYRMVEGLRAEARTRHIENVPVTFGTGFCTMDKENFDFEEGLRQSDLNMFADKANYHARK